MSRKIRVRRKAYNRKGYTRKGGIRVKRTHVPSTSFLERDRGAPGRGPRVLPKLKKGDLNKIADARYGKGYFSLNERQRHNVLKERKRRGDTERQLAGKLQAVANYDRRTNPAITAKATSDRRFVNFELFPNNGRHRREEGML